jgi:stearoyl-CoA desaturase (Delta-9 desaturase)
LFIIGYHALLVVVLPLYFMHHTPSWKLISITIALVYITGIAVTAGYHRLYSHLTYKTNPVVEAVLLFFASMATQGSALRWSFDHRHHHAFVDTDRDPYSIKKGFWYAHFLWLFEKPKDIDNKVISDLNRNPLLRFQHKYYGYLMVVTNLISTLFIGWWINDYLGAFVFSWLVRLFFLHHFTWFINSLAHTWGERNFCQELSAVDNYLISLVTFGEGYHNYHHTFAYDYRNGIRWYHFDPTKWLIWTLSMFGLAHNLKKNQHYFIEEKIILDKKQLFLDKVSNSFVEYREVWEEKITKLSESLVEKLRQIKQLKERYKGLKKDAKEESLDTLRELNAQIKAIKKSLKAEGRLWMDLSRNVMELPKAD